MESPEDRRLEISLRLKAARILAGRRTIGRKGNDIASPISTAELAEIPHLAENRVTRNRIEDIEQMKVDARPMELRAIAEALEMSPLWFDAPLAELLRPAAVSSQRGAGPLPGPPDDYARWLRERPPIARSGPHSPSTQEPEYSGGNAS